MPKTEKRTKAKRPLGCKAITEVENVGPLIFGSGYAEKGRKEGGGGQEKTPGGLQIQNWVQ